MKLDPLNIAVEGLRPGDNFSLRFATLGFIGWEITVEPQPEPGRPQEEPLRGGGFYSGMYDRKVKKRLKIKFSVIWNKKLITREFYVSNTSLANVVCDIKIAQEKKEKKEKVLVEAKLLKDNKIKIKGKLV